MQLAIILSIIELFLYFLLGGIAAALKGIKEDEVSRWSNFIVKYVYSLFIFSTIITGFDKNNLVELWPLPLLSIGIMIIGALISIPAKYGLKNRTKPLVRSFRNICAMNNFGFLPIIIIGRLWGDVGLSQLFIMHLGAYTGYWTLGILLFGGKDIKEMIKHLFNPSVIAIILGLIIKGSGLHQYIPTIFMEFSTKIGSGAVPLILMMIGANLFFSIKKTTWTAIYNTLYFTFLRLILIPSILIGLLLLLPLNETVFKISAIVALMPSSSMSSILSRIYGGDPEFTSQAALSTHLFAMITIPLGLYFLSI